MIDGSIQIIPVILCGGSGTRLWPASRESMPKQFIQLVGDCSTFQAAVLRAARSELFLRPIVLASNEVRFIAAEQLAQIEVSADVVLEPTRRDSAAAVAVAACQASRRNPEAVVAVLPADHVVGDSDAFVQACRDAAEVARKGFITTLGIRPTHAATGYGYIKPGAPISGSDAYAVERFVEKPDAATASRYIAEGRLWNGGYFVFRTDVMLSELQAFEPTLLAAAGAALDQATIDLDFVRLDKAAFAKAAKNSIDYAVMERTRKAAVVPVSFPWSDIGTWGLLWEASEKNEDGNVVRGNVEVLGSRNSLIHSEDILTTVVGLDDIVVVAKPDAVLVTSRKESDHVKDLIELLRSKDRPEADQHIRIYRPWGWYQRIDIGPRFQVKRIFVRPGGRLSLQKHFHRAEHWIVVKGTAEVTVDDQSLLLHENEAAQIPIGSVHRLANPGRIPLEIIEVQVGSYTGEDDIIRIEDVYGR